MDGAIFRDRRQNAIPSYEDQTVHWFTLEMIIWAIIALSGGLVVALQLTLPSLNFGATFYDVLVCVPIVVLTLIVTALDLDPLAEDDLEPLMVTASMSHHN